MVLVLLLAAALWGLGHVMGASRTARVGTVAALFGVVLLIQIALPQGHALRVATGGSLASWAIAAGIAAVFGLYAWLLPKLKARAPAANIAAKPEPEQSGPFSEAELDRYARHIILHEIGGQGQQRLKAARVLVIGAGGLGSPALLYLAAAGVGTIGVVDDDTVSLSNLQRQVLHDTASVGQPKVDSAAHRLMAINPHVSVVPLNLRLDAQNAPALFEGYDLILDGSDNFTTRFLVNETAVALGKPLVAAAISQWEGQIGVYHPASGGPCYACVFPNIPAPGLVPTCAEVGVMGALPGVVGAMMAVEAIKWITGAGEPLKGALLVYDALYGETRRMRAERSPDCKVCGGD